MKHNPENKKLHAQLEKWKEDPEKVDIIPWLVKNRSKGFEYSEVLFAIFSQQKNWAAACEIAATSLTYEPWTVNALIMYVESLEKLGISIEDLLGLYLVINDVTNGHHLVVNEKIIAALGELERHEEQIAAIEAAREIWPDHFNEDRLITHYTYSGIEKYRQKALKLIKSKAITDKSLQERVSLGSTYFYLGKIYDGLIHHFGGEDFRPREFVNKKSIPNGYKTDFNNKKVLITPYRGMGDSMILSRFIPKFLNKFPDVRFTILTEPSMIPLYEGIANVEHVGDHESCVGMHYDYVLGVNMLSRYLRDELVDENDSLNYHEWVSYDKKYDEKWNHLKDDSKKNIGFNWKGSQRLGGGSSSGVNTTRDIELDEFITIIDSCPEYQFICLNPYIELEERSMLQERENVLIPEIQDFGDTAAIMNLCDKVLSIDTSISTLSASMSVDTIVLGKYLPDYRWLHYEKWWDLSSINISVIKKDKPKDSWTKVIFRAIRELKNI